MAEAPKATEKPAAPPPGDSLAMSSFEVDSEHERTSIEYDSEWDSTSSTASLSSSILNYRKINGRSFYNFDTENEYWGPNDNVQNEHLDINHEMLLRAMDNKLFFAPIGDAPKTVLDVGTGTGIWAIDFANQFPSAEVIGTDISPTQPNWHPENCSFQIDDAGKEWTFPDNHFDYIHMRLLMGSIKDWSALYKEVYRCLKPGGWVEHQDYDPHVISDDNSIHKDSAWHQWGPLFCSAGEKLGQSFAVIIDQANVRTMKEGGFVNVQEKRLKLPLGGWPADPKWKVVGQYNQLATDSGLQGFAIFVLPNVLGWKVEEANAYVDEVRKELHNRKNHAYYYTASVWGQKPLAADEPKKAKEPRAVEEPKTAS